MKIHNQRDIDPSANSSTHGVAGGESAARARQNTEKGASVDGDNWQLSNLALQVQSAVPTNDTSRAAMVQRIASEVKSGTYAIDYSKIGRAMIVEASTLAS